MPSLSCVSAFGSVSSRFPVVRSMWIPSLEQDVRGVVACGAVDADADLHASGQVFLIGAMPDPRRMFEQGQCAAPHPVWANFVISSSSTWIAWANHTSSPSQPCVSIQSTGRSWNRSRV